MTAVRKEVRKPVGVSGLRRIDHGDRSRLAAGGGHSVDGGIMSGAKRIVPSRLQVPPLPFSASQSVKAGPPEISIFLSLPSAKKPTAWLSGDQNG